MPRSPNDASSDGPRPSTEWQSLISLGLFVHLFMISVAISSYVAPSELQTRLQGVFAPYLQTLNFNLNHTYGSSPRLYLTHAAITDVDFSVEVSEKFSDDRAPKRVLPPDDISWPIRRRRYQSLANAMGSVLQNENAESILPRAVGGALLRQMRLDHGELRIRRHLLLGTDEAGSADPNVRNPYATNYFQTGYEAQLIANGGAIELMKKGEARDVSPVERRAADAARPSAERRVGSGVEGILPNAAGPSFDAAPPSNVRDSGRATQP